MWVLQVCESKYLALNKNCSSFAGLSSVSEIKLKLLANCSDLLMTALGLIF